MVLPNGAYETWESVTEMGEDTLRNELESMNIAYQDPRNIVRKNEMSEPFIAEDNLDYKKGEVSDVFNFNGVKVTAYKLIAFGDRAPENSVWRKYAVSNEIRFEEDFASFVNMSGGVIGGLGRDSETTTSLPALPTENYPNKNPINIKIRNTNIDSIGGLSSIESVSKLDLSGNNLTEINFPLLEEIVSGESSLVELNLSNNKLIDLDGLSSLRVLEGELFLGNNLLTNISGLSNLNVGGYIHIDKEYSGPKLEATTTFCEENSSYQFENGISHTAGVYTTKDMVCESPIIEGPDR